MVTDLDRSLGLGDLHTGRGVFSKEPLTEECTIASMTNSEKCRQTIERRFSFFESYDVEELEMGAVGQLKDALDEEASMAERITALETFLAMEFYLHKQRLAWSADPLETESEIKLMERFAEAFSVEEGWLRGLYDYCNDNAFRYFRIRRMVTWGQWRRLADGIRNEIDKQRAI